MELEHRIEPLVHSLFPDVSLIKKTLLESGAVPPKYRGEIWSLFLCGSVLRDEESFDHINEQVNYREIHQISSQILKIWYHHGSRFEPSPHFLDELSDILALYCKRMNLQFHSPNDIYLCNILLPLLSTTQPLPRGLASSCFYSLCTSFLPLSPFLSSSPTSSSLLPSLTYETIKHNLITDKLSSWLRILLSYHFPSLAIHLDSIYPNWEKISFNDRSQVFGEEVVLEGHANGTHLNGPKEPQFLGLLPPSWIGGMFAGSFLTSASILRLWDWCILWDQKFASLYLTVSLLGLHEELILQMTTPTEIVDWVHSVCEGGIKAFAQCKAFPAASSFRPHDISHCTEPLTPSRLFGDEFDDDDEFHLSPALTNLENHRVESNSLLPLKENVKTPNHYHNRNTSSISVSIGWDGETDDQSDSDDEAAAAFFSQCAVPQSPPSPSHNVHEPLAPVEELVFETPDQRHSEETYTQEITLERLEELFLAGWVACTSRLIRNTPTTFQMALSQLTEWATARAREEYLSRQNRRGSTDSRDSLPSSLSKPVPVEYRKSDELDHSSHNWSLNIPDATRARAPSSPGGDEDVYIGPGEELNEESDLIEDLNSRASESKTKFQLMVETSTIAAEYGKSIWERVSQKAKTPQEGGVRNSPSAEQESPISVAEKVKSTPWPYHEHPRRMCLFTAPEEVLPCVCSTRRRSNVTSESLFLEAFQKFSTPPEGDVLSMPSSFPNPLTESATLTERPFYFAVDCWPDLPEEQLQAAIQEDDPTHDTLSSIKRICRIPKAFQMSYTAITDAQAMIEMLNVLEPLAHVVHIVLIGIGPEIIQQHQYQQNSQQKTSKLGLLSRNKDDSTSPVEDLVIQEEAQIGAMAMALMKHGYPHVSILEGGYSSVLKYLWSCDGRGSSSSQSSSYRSSGGAGGGSGGKRGEEIALGMHVLVDVDHGAVQQLLQSKSPVETSCPTVPSGSSVRRPSGTAPTVADLLSTTASAMGMFRRR